MADVTHKSSPFSYVTRNRNFQLFFWFLIAALSFWLLDRYSLSLGDDFGYMFADSKNHCYDGDRVKTFSDCIMTQRSHYVTTNGRVIVHTAVMSFLNLVPDTVYRILNSLVFGCLWLLTFLLSFKKLRVSTGALILLSLIWWLIPDTGIVMLSLVAYSVNYLWTGTIILLVLFLTKRCENLNRIGFVLLCFLAMIAGTLHESFSIPLSGAFVAYAIFRFRKISARKKLIFLLFTIGTLLLICAPGNISHFQSGGGFEGAGLQNKFVGMIEWTALSPITLLFVILISASLFSHKRTVLFLKSNFILVSSIMIAIIFAIFTFTAPRQLFAPSIFATMAICRLLDGLPPLDIRLNILIDIILSLFLCASFLGGVILRKAVYENYMTFLEETKSQKTIIACPDASKAPYNSMPILWNLAGRFAPDPWEMSRFSFPFDSYSRRGLSRLVFGSNDPDKIKSILPYSLKMIKEKIPTAAYMPDGIYKIYPLDSKYGAVRVLGQIPSRIETVGGENIKSEIIRLKNDDLLIVFPNQTDKIRLFYKK